MIDTSSLGYLFGPPKNTEAHGFPFHSFSGALDGTHLACDSKLSFDLMPDNMGSIARAEDVLINLIFRITKNTNLGVVNEL